MPNIFVIFFEETRHGKAIFKMGNIFFMEKILFALTNPTRKSIKMLKTRGLALQKNSLARALISGILIPR